MKINSYLSLGVESFAEDQCEILSPPLHMTYLQYPGLIVTCPESKNESLLLS